MEEKFFKNKNPFQDLYNVTGLFIACMYALIFFGKVSLPQPRLPSF